MAFSATLGHGANFVSNNGPLVLAVSVLGLFFLLGLFCVSYTYGQVVATLAIVEDTSARPEAAPPASLASVDAPPPYSDDPNARLSDDRIPAETSGDEVILLTGPLTSSLRGTVKHLRSRAGFFSRFRGFRVAMILTGLTSIITQIGVSITGSSFIAATILSIIANVLLARLYMLWTHIIISEPSPRPFWRRFARGRSARQIYLPTLVWAVAQAVLTIPAIILATDHFLPKVKALPQHDPENRKDLVAPAIGMVLCVVAAVAVIFVLTLPFQVMLVRCQAALLPEDETPIVPLDRGFGGKVVPLIEGGSGRLRIKDAWKSCSWSDWRRIALVYVKTAALQLLLYLSFCFMVAVCFMTLYVKPDDRN